MKKTLCTLLALLLLCTNAFAATFEIDTNPDYKTPVIADNHAQITHYRLTYADTSKPVDFNDKATGYKNFYGYNASSWFGSEYEFSWIPGPSGEEGDWAPSVTATTLSAASASAQLYLFYQGGDQKLKEGGGTIYAEFDLMVNTTTDRLELADIPMWNPDTGASSRYLFTPDGYLRGTDYQYKAGEWMHFKMIIDYDANTWNVWIDDVKAVDNKPIASRYSWDKNTRFQFFIRQTSEKAEGEPKAGFAVDNFLTYAVGKDISEFVTLEAMNADGEVVSPDAVSVNPQIKLTFADGFSTELINEENIVIENEKGASIPYEMTSDASGYILTPTRTLGHEQTYRVRISDELRKSKSSYRPPVGGFSFVTDNNREVVIDSCSLSSAEPGAAAAVSTSVTNNTGADFEAAVTVAVYNSSNGVTSISRKPVTLTPGANTLTDALSLTLPDDFSNESLVKIFITPSDSYRIIDEDVFVN